MVKKLFMIFIVIMMLPISVSANLIYDPGFEISPLGSITPGFPTDYGLWTYDPATIVGTENSITPLDGNQMLRFDRSSALLGATGTGSDIYQYINLSSYQNEMSTGTTAYASAFFNRVTGDAQTDNEFYLFVYSYSGDLSQKNVSTNVWSSTITTDSDPTTWQQILFPVVLPDGTDYISVRITAKENIFDDENLLDVKEYDGHYADNIYFGFSEPIVPVAPVPEPSTMLLLGSGMAGLAFLRRRFGKV